MEKDLRFDTERGSETLKDCAAGCLSCSSIADGFNGFALHLSNHDVILWAVARAPLEKLTPYKQRMGWSFPWASSCQADFNFDYQVSITEEQQREGVASHNYEPGALMIDLKPQPPGVAAPAVDRGTDAAPISATGPA